MITRDQNLKRARILKFVTDFKRLVKRFELLDVTSIVQTQNSILPLDLSLCVRKI